MAEDDLQNVSKLSGLGSVNNDSDCSFPNISSRTFFNAFYDPMIYVGQFEICAPNVYEYSLVVVVVAVNDRSVGGQTKRWSKNLENLLP